MEHKVIKIDTNGNVTVQFFAEPLYQTMGADLDGLIEHVRPMRLPPPYCMIVDDEGLLKGLPINQIGCLLYQTDRHGQPIVGDIYIMRDTDDNFVGLTDDDFACLLTIFEQLSDFLYGGV